MLCWLKQVLPSGMVVLAEPSPDSLLAALEEAVLRVHSVDPLLQHEQVRFHTVLCYAEVHYLS